jgi:pimeloyl-ACP methyl ester carboxylesterase
MPAPLVLSRRLTLKGVGYHYLQYPAAGPPVLLLHGLGSSSYSWEETAPLLQDAGYHLYALDLKGSGGSDKPAGADYSLLALAAEIDRWLETLGLKEVVFVGNSLGGSLGLLLALEKPDRISRLVLIAAGAYITRLPWVFRLARLPFAKALAPLVFKRRLIRLAMHQAFYHQERVTAERIEAYYRRLQAPGCLAAQVDLVRGLDFDELDRYNARLPSIAIPTLLLWGENDPWIPLFVGSRLKVALPRSTLEVIPRCGHAPQEELPEKTAELITDWLKSTSSPIGGGSPFAVF